MAELVWPALAALTAHDSEHDENFMAYAKAADVQAVFGRALTAEEAAPVDRRLAQVERMILRKIPDLANQTDAGDLDEAHVIDIEAEAVLRLVRNHEGYASESDGTYTYQFHLETASGRLEILAEEWERLGIKPSRTFSITPNLIAPVHRSFPGIGGRRVPAHPWNRDREGLRRSADQRF